MKNKIYRLFHWEYWPLLMFYIPNIPFALFYAMKAKSLVFYTATNPGIKNAGIGSESKYKTLQMIPNKFTPKSILHKKDQNIETTLTELKTAKITYPIIIKPDIGFRGGLVKKINTEIALRNYLEKYPITFIIQEFLTHKYECGIFYYRHPNEKKGTITSITLKEFLSVRGDGISTLKELVHLNNRASLYYEILQEDVFIDWNIILKKNTLKKLSSIGNHSKGTQFLNGNHLINKNIENTLDLLSHQIKGWYYGRLDIKYNSIEELSNGNFKIIEINGIMAEPGNIYDARKINYFKALKIIRTHWKQLYLIAEYNKKHNGVKLTKTVPFVKEMIALKKYSIGLKKLSKKNKLVH